MTLRASAVIGAGFGDEGKGRHVCFLCDQYEGSTIVVRHNGGAQAGHTVHRGSQRHCFHTFGSGTLVGSSTYLGPEFVINPRLWSNEWSELRLTVGEPRPLIVDRRCRVSTPYDVWINREVEKQRGGDRHGSCGIGFGETVGRCSDPAFDLRIGMIGESPNAWRDAFNRVRFEWFPSRVRELDLPQTDLQLMLSDEVAVFHSDIARSLWAMSKSVGDASQAFEGLDGAVVFEGAQGLLLDQNRWDFFPHLTRSNTGIANALDLCSEAGIADLPVYYMLRAYLTRHGAGPLPTESDWNSVAIEDKTNGHNSWQGHLRFGIMDAGLVKDAVTRDVESKRGPGVRRYPMLVVGHMDQISGSAFYRGSDSSLSSSSPSAYPKTLSREIGIPLHSSWHGSSSNPAFAIREAGWVEA
jgi:adenylosuccinate synthase